MKELVPIEFKKQRIMTTKTLAEQFGTDENNIQKNFSNNKERFKEGKHYIELKGQALKDFKNSLPNEIQEPLKFAPVLYLWTERGVARHAKILETDVAWDIYEELEDNYFNPRENKIQPQLPNDYLSALKALVVSEEERQKLEEERQRLEEENAKQEPFVKVAKERLLKGEKISITDISKSLDLKRGQLTTYLKTNGYLNKKHNEVNKKGEGMFGVYKEGNFNCIGILENGIDFINEHLEEIKISPCRYSRNN